MKYIDTSVLVSALLPEATSAAALAWLTSHSDAELAISPWVGVEFSGAVARKLRMGRITAIERQNALDEFADVWIATATLIQVNTNHLDLARQICDADRASIRPGDAVHLATASLSHMPLITFDKSFAAGAVALGYAVELIV